MKLVYHFFGNVAFLMRTEPVKLAGTIHVECDVPDGSRLVLYSTDEKEVLEYKIENGGCDVPSSIFIGGKNVYIGVGDVLAVATPIREFQTGNTTYLIGVDFSVQEELKRVAEALIYVGNLAKQASRDSKDALSLKGRVDELYDRANSGDIINF